ncbi:hypothetical protein ACNF42_01595 [Cuniculiplasma sp. SKW3]|uniref:hypothetical protein n=1 Tax=unclassified Cuniculiplasma TaxID=2619706 RepID=UPI003FD6AA92
MEKERSTNIDGGVVRGVNFIDVYNKAGFIKTVPAGVGTVATSIIMKNFMAIAMKRVEEGLNY